MYNCAFNLHTFNMKNKIIAIIALCCTISLGVLCGCTDAQMKARNNQNNDLKPVEQTENGDNTPDDIMPEPTPDDELPDDGLPDVMPELPDNIPELPDNMPEPLPEPPLDNNAPNEEHKAPPHHRHCPNGHCPDGNCPDGHCPKLQPRHRRNSTNNFENGNQLKNNAKLKNGNKSKNENSPHHKKPLPQDKTNTPEKEM
jgi:type IV secretory pathway VirB10-like protein